MCNQSENQCPRIVCVSFTRVIVNRQTWVQNYFYWIRISTDEEDESEYLSVLPDDSYTHQVREPLAYRVKGSNIDLQSPQRTENSEFPTYSQKPSEVGGKSILEVSLEVFI